MQIKQDCVATVKVCSQNISYISCCSLLPTQFLFIFMILMYNNFQVVAVGQAVPLMLEEDKTLMFIVLLFNS